jgi:hypothetical protein
MSDLLPPALPGPSDSARPGPEIENQSGSTRHSRFPFRSVEECMYLLDQLPGLLAMGSISPAQSNSIRGAIREILAFHQRPAGGSATAAALDRDLLERLRREPQLMNTLAPLFTAEQIATLMGTATNGQR